MRDRVGAAAYRDESTSFSTAEMIIYKIAGARYFLPLPMRSIQADAVISLGHCDISASPARVSANRADRLVINRGRCSSEPMWLSANIEVTREGSECAHDLERASLALPSTMHVIRPQ